MPSVFFKIGDTDYTPRVDPQSYAVQLTDVFRPWTDGNGIEHREVFRQRRAGSFNLGFSSMADFAAWTAELASSKASGGFYPVTAYISNSGATDSFSAFLDVENPQDSWDLAHSRQWLVAKVTLTEV